MKLSALFQSNFITISLIIVSLLCLYPGLTEPIMSFRIGVTLPIVGDMEFYNKTQSIWSSILSLYESDYTFVAFLIFLFSIAVPVFKLFALTICIAFQKMEASTTLA